LNPESNVAYFIGDWGRLSSEGLPWSDGKACGTELFLH
jgi:hypothetical protein